MMSFAWLADVDEMVHFLALIIDASQLYKLNGWLHLLFPRPCSQFFDRCRRGINKAVPMRLQQLLFVPPP